MLMIFLCWFMMMRSFTHFKSMLPLGLIVSVPVLYCITQTKTELSSFYDLNTSLTVKFAKLNPHSLSGIVSKQILPNQVFRQN